MTVTDVRTLKPIKHARSTKLLYGGDQPMGAVPHHRTRTPKPTGPVIYNIEKGADVWPGRSRQDTK